VNGAGNQLLHAVRRARPWTGHLGRRRFARRRCRVCPLAQARQERL